MIEPLTGENPIEVRGIVKPLPREHDCYFNVEPADDQWAGLQDVLEELDGRFVRVTIQVVDGGGT